MLRVKDLKLFHDTNDLINLELRLGEGLIIDGAPGSGKTKLFKVLTGLLRPISGDIYYQETSLYNSDFIDLGRLRKMIGAIFERPTIMSNLTLEQNIDFILKSRQEVWDNKIYNLIDKFELRKDLSERKLRLSKDAILRFNLLKIILSNPSIIFLDDFTSSKIKSANKCFYEWVDSNRDNISIVVFGRVASELNDFINKTYLLNHNSFRKMEFKNAG